MGFTIIWRICEFLAKDSNGSYYSCMMVQIVQSPLKTSWHIVITGLCQLVFLVVFLTVYKVWIKLRLFSLGIGLCLGLV
jgi:hypothetical protein